MKTLYSFFVYTSIFLVLIACSKDPNDPYGNSNNNGNGNESPCEVITCLNGGICINGLCDCPDGYSGPECGQLDLDVTIRINQIVISGYPQTNGNSAWDDPFLGSSTTADVSFRIIRPSGSIFNSATYFPNALGGPITFISTSGLPFVISSNDVDNAHTFQVMDLDDIDSSDLGSSDDIMVSLSFIPETLIDGPGTVFPSTITLSNGATVVQLSVTYEW